jgi:hypothetical protein
VLGWGLASKKVTTFSSKNQDFLWRHLTVRRIDGG